MACLVILAIIFGLVWVVEFAQLMALRDEDFPGRHDKALWVAAFVFGNVLGAVAFFLWKRDREFGAREDVLQRMARAAGHKEPPAPSSPPPPPAAEPVAQPAVPSSTAIQRPADNRA
jgi:hypothetical protein